MDIGSMATAASSMKAAADIVKTLSNLKSISDIQAVSVELQSKILAAQTDALAAQSEQASMIQKISELKKQIADIKAWEEEKQRYALVSPLSGGLVYALKKERAGTEPPHWICTKCYEDGRKSILNQMERDAKGFWKIVCPICKSQIDSHYRSPYQPKYAEETITD